jgi:hypothetical protein
MRTVVTSKPNIGSCRTASTNSQKGHLSNSVFTWILINQISCLFFLFCWNKTKSHASLETRQTVVATQIGFRTKNLDCNFYANLGVNESMKSALISLAWTKPTQQTCLVHPGTWKKIKRLTSDIRPILAVLPINLERITRLFQSIWRKVVVGWKPLL